MEETAMRIYARIKQNSAKYYELHREQILQKKKEKYVENRENLPKARRGRPRKVSPTPVENVA